MVLISFIVNNGTKDFTTVMLLNLVPPPPPPIREGGAYFVIKYFGIKLIINLVDMNFNILG